MTPESKTSSAAATFFSVTTFTAVLLSVTLFANAAQAQKPAEHETWYQVELILFRQGGNPADHVEQWPNDIKLSYPLDWQVLTNEPPPQAGAEITPDAETSSTDTLSTEPANVDPMSLVPESRKLHLLPSAQLTLNDQARRIQRSNRYRILFHGGWLQGMVEYGEEPSIVITAGDVSGKHHELEGSINLKLQRYLHITTDLWITNFAANFGQERERWPELPLAPYLPRAAAQTTSRDSSGSSNYWTQFQVSSSEYDSQLNQPYIIENIAKIQQTRRMRSSELHYIDHPLVGILIQFTPVDAPRAN